MLAKNTEPGLQHQELLEENRTAVDLLKSLEVAANERSLLSEIRFERTRRRHIPKTTGVGLTQQTTAD